MRTLEAVLRDHGLPFPDVGGVPAKLEDLQIEDINRLATMGRALADLPIGYGKTVISTYSALMLEPDVTLILMPPILKAQWQKWINSIPGAGQVVVYDGTPSERRKLNLRGAKWIITSYGLMRNDFDYLLAQLGPRNLLTIVDEAQCCKNYKSSLFDCVKQISEGKPLFLLSGTPVSWPGDTYAYIKLNNPGAYARYRQFENIHVAERDFFEKPTAWREWELMQSNFNANRIYRSKEEVHAALPKANFIPVYYELDKEHMALYTKLMQEQLLELDDGTKIDATTAQTLYHQSQQIISNWGYFSGNPKNVGKVYELIDEICDQINLGQPDASKVIAWSQYKRTSAALQDHMDARLKKIGCRSMAAYSGADSVKSVAAFMDDPRTVSLVAQPGSAGAGLNPQALCWNTIFVELPTRTIAFLQAAGRIDRKGQRFNPNIYLFIARGTIQEALLANLMSNDDEVIRATGTKNSIRNLIFPK
jgi:SNF2 family DNA or RNA helicase